MRGGGWGRRRGALSVRRRGGGPGPVGLRRGAACRRVGKAGGAWQRHEGGRRPDLAGVPVYATRGTGGGWSLSEEYRTETGGLNEAEVQAVFLARPQKLLADLGLNQAAEVGLL